MRIDRALGGIEQALLDDYETYDQHANVVSAFEWLFTDHSVKGLPVTVAHFERFPRIARGDGTYLTPDFTVLFKDGSAIVAEIARIALHDNSVDKLCRQIGNYDTISQVPDAGGVSQPAERVDVLQIVSAQIGLTTVRRVIRDRYLDPTHEYKPSRPPCIVQFSSTDAVYAFQRIPDPINGTLFAGDRTPNVGNYLDNDLKVRADRFVGVKARTAFINDPVTPLYLATHLWTRTFPTLFGSERNDVTVAVQEIASVLRSQYGVGRTSEIRQALQLLESAGLAAADANGVWTVSRRLLGRSGERDVHRIIAKRAAYGGRRLVVSRTGITSGSEVQDGTLF